MKDKTRHIGILKRINDGVLYKEIAKEFKVSACWVSKLATSNGMQRGSGRREEPIPDAVYEMRRLRESGMSYSKLAKRFKVSHQAIISRLQYHGMHVPVYNVSK